MKKKPPFLSLFIVLFALAFGILGTIYVLQEADFRKNTTIEHILEADVLDTQLRQLGVLHQVRLAALAVKTCECLNEQEQNGFHCLEFNYSDRARDKIREQFQLSSTLEVDLKINQLHFSLAKKNCNYPKLDSLFKARIQYLYHSQE